MFLSKLEIQGFKSFAEKVVLKFNKELTAIVGPNGSGKSNVSDAVRWVLGEQSLKILRGKKSDDVIFAGSGKRTRLGFAEVSLYLDNSDGKAPLDYREIVITRRIYRDGEGEYLINKNKVRLADIQMLLAKASFGQRTYSIIGQGMIDSLLTSSPSERKELFDEATGVRQYQLKKNQAILKLERSESNLLQSEQLLLEIEPRLRSLNRQVKKLEHKEELESRLTEFQTNYYSKILSELKSKRQNLINQFQTTKAQKQAVEEKISASQKNIDEEQKSDTQATAWQKLQNEYEDLVAQKNRLSQELSLIKAKIDLNLTQAGKTDVVWLQNKHSDLAGQIQSINQKIIELEKNKAKLEKFLNDKLDQQQKVIAEFKDLQEQLMAAQKNQNKNEQLSLTGLKQHLQELYTRQSNFIEALTQVKDSTDLQKIKDQAATLLEKIKWLNGRLDDADGQTNHNLLELQEKLNDFITTKDLLVNEIQDLKLQLAGLNQNLINQSALQKQLTAEKNKIEQELAAVAATDVNEANQLLNKQKTEQELAISQLDSQLTRLQRQLNEFSEDQEKKKNRFIELQQELRQQQLKLNVQNAGLNEINVELARLETKNEDLEKEIASEFIGRFELLQTTLEINLGETSAEINRLKNQLAVIGGIDNEVMAEYEEVSQRHTFLSEQTLDLKQAIAGCHQLIEELDEKISQQFETAFKKINERYGRRIKTVEHG